MQVLEFSTFKYSRYIANLTEDEFNEARDAVMTMYSGVKELWGRLDEKTRDGKRYECYALLIIWYLCDMLPTRVTGGVSTTAGMPLAAKSIKSVQLQFRKMELPPSYEALCTNQFGIKAANMMRYAPEMMGVYG